MIFSLFFKISLVTLFALNANITSSAQETYGQRAFEKDLRRTNQDLQYLAYKRPFRLKNLNDSIKMTAIASNTIFTQNSYQLSMQALRKAHEIYEGNAYALLLLAYAHEKLGHFEQSTQLYEDFLTKSQGFTDFERKFIKRDRYYRLRRYVYNLLIERGVQFEGREDEIRTRIPFMTQLLNPDAGDQWMMYGLLFVIFGGALLFLCLKLLGVTLPETLAKGFAFFYAGSWLAYLAWIMDIVVELPGNLSRNQVVPGILALSALIAVLLPIIGFLREYFRQPGSGYQKCPGCRQIIANAMLECPDCGRRLQS